MREGYIELDIFAQRPRRLRKAHEVTWNSSFEMVDAVLFERKWSELSPPSQFP